MTSITARIAT